MSLWSSEESNVGISSICTVANLGLAATTFTTLLMYQSYRKSLPQSQPIRPKLVLDAIANNKPLYYFGVGSNLSRKKLEERSICGKKINPLSFEPCVIPHHRLAFNLRAFPPLEPAMGSLEPLPSFYNKDDSSEKVDKNRRSVSLPLKSYEREECHGALIKLSTEDYEKVYKSEGGGQGLMQGYEEYIVRCVPYDKSKRPVQAVAFRVRDHARLSNDPCPSQRYMNIIKEGANELGLKPCYLKWLEEHPVQGKPSRLLKFIAINNMVFIVTSSMLLKFRLISYIQTQLLFKVYVPSTEPRWKQIVGEILSGMIMLPTALVGAVLRGILATTGKMPPGFQKMIASLDE